MANQMGARWKNSLRIGLILTGIAASSICELRVIGQSPQSLKQKLKRDVAAKWEEYRRISKTIQGTSSLRVVYESEGQKKDGIPAPREVKTVIKQNSFSGLVHWQTLQAGKERNNIIGWNEQYSFYLGGDSKERLRLERYDPGQNGEKTFLNQSSYNSHLDNEASFLLLLDYLPVDKFIDDARFTVLSIKRITQDESDLLEIAFSFRHGLEEKPWTPVQGGTFLLDPLAFFCIRGCPGSAQSGILVRSS